MPLVYRTIIAYNSFNPREQAQGLSFTPLPNRKRSLHDVDLLHVTERPQ